jgi:hypothetical protein
MKFSLKTLIPALALALIAVIGCAKEEGPQYVFGTSENPLTGVVTDDRGNPLEGITVTDGFTVTRTDSKGAYSIEARNKEAYYVYYTIPADAVIETDANGRPCFYHKLTANVDNYDFVIKKQAVEQKFRILTLGDPQVRASNSGLVRFAEETVPDVREYVASKGGDMPTYAITMGDLVHNEWHLFPDIFKLLSESSLSVPCFSVIGNHDHEFNGTTAVDDIRGRHKYEAFAGPVNYAFDRGNCHILVLDNINHRGQDEHSYSEELTEQIKEWMTAELSNVSREKTLLVFAHAPFVNSDVNNAVIDIFAEFADVRIFAGHSHSLYNTEVTATNGKVIPVNVVGTTNGVDWCGTICGDGAPHGYGNFEIEGGTVKNYIYKPVKMDEGFQMRMYKSDEFASFKASTLSGSPTFTFGVKEPKVMLNIWNVTDAWTFDIYENDTLVEGAELTLEPSAYDVWACFFFYQIKKRSTFSFCQRKDHIFSYTMQNPEASLRVVAHDEYGNTFEQTIFTTSKETDYPSGY